MKSKINLSRLAKVVALAFVAILVFASASPAQSLSLTYPRIEFDSGGTTVYDSVTDELSVVASTLAVQFGPPSTIPCLFVVSSGSFRINVKVSDSGVVSGISGVDGLSIKGGALSIPPFLIPNCLPAGMPLDFLSGDLVKGNVQAAFGYNNDPDRLELRFTVTGGAFFGGISQIGVIVSIDSDPSRPSTFTGVFTTGFTGSATGTAGVPVAATLPPPPPTVTTSGNQVIEALGPGGAIATFAASATAFGGPVGALGVTCVLPSGSLFPLGPLGTTVTCTSEPDGFNQRGVNTLNVKVQDTTPPILIGDDIDVEATGQDGALVPLAVTASDLVDGDDVPVTCSPASGSLFPIGPGQPVTCQATDASGNPALPLTFTVTVKVVPPDVSGEGCFILNFREITYFKGLQVIMSSDADIRARNGIAGVFNPSVWPYRASGGSAYTTSRGTLFRVYGFQPSQLGREVQDADIPWTKYLVKFDNDTKGYYVDLGGPARVSICDAQLHAFVLTGKKGNGHKEGSTLLPVPQRNVPGVMLTHNAQIVKVPNRVRWEMYQLGLGAPARGLIDYIGFQLQGNGNAAYREFVDVEVLFPGDSATDRKQHYASGFHTATNTNFETFAGCSYLDSAPGNDAVRLRDVWGPNRSRNLGYWSFQACGTKEPAANQKRRANYEVPFNAIQILPTVNTHTDTLRLFYGAIGPIPERERNKKDHKLDWGEWDRWDH